LPRLVDPVAEDEVGELEPLLSVEPDPELDTEPVEPLAGEVELTSDPVAEGELEPLLPVAPEVALAVVTGTMTFIITVLVSRAEISTYPVKVFPLTRVTKF